jgi:hypothetical protein
MQASRPPPRSRRLRRSHSPRGPNREQLVIGKPVLRRSAHRKGDPSLIGASVLRVGDQQIDDLRAPAFASRALLCKKYYQITSDKVTG